MKRRGLFPRKQARQTKALVALDAYWTLTTELLLSELHTTRKSIQQIDAESRLKPYGLNALQAQQKNTAFGLLLSQFKSHLVLILIFESSVLRDGKPQMVPSEQVVPGDVVLFSAAGRVGVIYYVLSKIGLCLCWMIFDTTIPEPL